MYLVPKLSLGTPIFPKLCLGTSRYYLQPI